MPKVKNKVRLCTTKPLSVFIVESVGGTPFYNRRSDFERLLVKYVKDSRFKSFFAMPYFDSAEHGLEWHVDPELGQAVRLSSVVGTQQYTNAKHLLNEAILYFRNLTRVATEQEQVYFKCMLKYIDSTDIDNTAFVIGNQVILGVWGLKSLPGHDAKSAIVTDVDDTRLHRVSFASSNATFSGTTSFMRRHGYRLHPGIDVPNVVPNEGFKFVGWEPFDPNNAQVNEDLTFTAQCEAIVEPPELPQKPKATPPEFTPPSKPEPPAQPAMHKVSFEGGHHGTLSGAPASTQIADGLALPPEMVPVVTPLEGYRFVGWDAPIGNPIHGDITFKALYEKEELPWWKTLLSESCLRQLLIALLALMVLLILAIVLTRCTSCSHRVGGCSGGGSEIGQIRTRDGRYIDDNGNRRAIRDITVDDDGNAIDGWDDDDEVAPPLVDDDGNIASPVNPQDPNDPNSPKVMANRLNIFFEDDNADFDKFAREFHRAYPGDDYKIIGKDRQSNWIGIQVPEGQREKVRDELPSKITSPRFRVVDETIMHGGPQARTGMGTMATPSRGWHIQAARLQQAWSISKGDPSVTVAIVDDGIDLNHELIASRITQPYNVFRCDDHMSAGQGHGTHVAGLAAGDASHLSQGVAGAAPGCKIMPVQVFDNGQCTASSVIRGIMYAIHHDADVVNVSIGTAYPVELGYIVPEPVQEQVAQTQFKDAEQVWKWVIGRAASKNAILVFAAGNSHLLASIEPQLRSKSTINVGAIDSNNSITRWSNYGPTVTVSAPGEAIYSSFPGNRYQAMDGTSMAAPIVSGVVALMKSVNRDVTVTQALQALTSTGTSTGSGRCGPAINAQLALKKIQQST